MQASCGRPLHWLGALGPGTAFTIFVGGVGFWTFTTFVAGAGTATTTAVGAGVTAETGACAGGSDAQALRTNASAIVSEYRETMVPIPRSTCGVMEENATVLPDFTIALLPDPSPLGLSVKQEGQIVRQRFKTTVRQAYKTS